MTAGQRPEGTRLGGVEAVLRAPRERGARGGGRGGDIWISTEAWVRQTAECTSRGNDTWSFPTPSPESGINRDSPGSNEKQASGRR